MSQVLVLTVAGLRFCRHLRRKSATGEKKRRRSDCFCRPATFPSVTCDVSFRHLGRLIAADRESEATFHHEADGVDGKTVYIGPAHACEIVAHSGVQINAQPGSDHVLRAGTYPCRPLEGSVLLLPGNGLVAVDSEVVGKEIIHFTAGKHVDPPAGAADNVKVEVDGNANPVLHIVYGHLGEHKSVIGVICGE